MKFLQDLVDTWGSALLGCFAMAIITLAWLIAVIIGESCL